MSRLGIEPGVLRLIVVWLSEIVWLVVLWTCCISVWNLLGKNVIFCEISRFFVEYFCENAESWISYIAYFHVEFIRKKCKFIKFSEILRFSPVIFPLFGRKYSFFDENCFNMIENSLVGSFGRGTILHAVVKRGLRGKILTLLRNGAQVRIYRQFWGG